MGQRIGMLALALTACAAMGCVENVTPDEAQDIARTSAELIESGQTAQIPAFGCMSGFAGEIRVVGDFNNAAGFNTTAPPLVRELSGAWQTACALPVLSSCRPGTTNTTTAYVDLVFESQGEITVQLCAQEYSGQIREYCTTLHTVTYTGSTNARRDVYIPDSEFNTVSSNTSGFAYYYIKVTGDGASDHLLGINFACS